MRTTAVSLLNPVEPNELNERISLRVNLGIMETALILGNEEGFKKMIAWILE